MNITYQDLLDNPDLAEKAQAQGRREHAAAARRLLIDPLQRLLETKQKVQCGRD